MSCPSIIGDTGATGATGVTGATGAASGLNAYGGVFNNTPQTLTLAAATPTVIPMANAMATSNVTPGANTLTVTQSGNYEIMYQVNATASIGAAVTVAVRENGTNIPSTVTTKTLAAGVENVYEGQVLVALTAGDVIDLAISALVAVTATLGTGVSATLTVKKLDA